MIKEAIEMNGRQEEIEIEIDSELLEKIRILAKEKQLPTEEYISRIITKAVKEKFFG